VAVRAGRVGRQRKGAGATGGAPAGEGGAGRRRRGRGDPGVIGIGPAAADGARSGTGLGDGEGARRRNSRLVRDDQRDRRGREDPGESRGGHRLICLPNDARQMSGAVAVDPRRPRRLEPGQRHRAGERQRRLVHDHQGQLSALLRCIDRQFFLIGALGVDPGVTEGGALAVVIESGRLAGVELEMFS